MGVQIKDILEYEEIKLNTISNKKIAIDSFNMLYQFLSSIRQSDGNLLTDSKGEITSHLKGIFSRCVYFKKNNIKPIFVFDGIAPKLKKKERKNREEKKKLAEEKLKEALSLGLTEDAAKFAKGTSRLTPKIVEEAKELIKAFGFAVFDAPSEGEAQAAYFTNKLDVFASASQDFDSLLFGAKHLIRNLSISNKRKVPGTSIYRENAIEFYDLNKNLEKLKIDRDSLIVVAILCGTDFNPGGIKGIGPKKALKLVKEYRGRFDELFKILDWFSYFDFPWIDVFNTFKKMPIDTESKPKFGEFNKEEILKILEKRDFNREATLKKLNEVKSVKTLDTYFNK